MKSIEISRELLKDGYDFCASWSGTRLQVANAGASSPTRSLKAWEARPYVKSEV